MYTALLFSCGYIVIWRYCYHHMAQRWKMCITLTCIKPKPNKATRKLYAYFGVCILYDWWWWWWWWWWGGGGGGGWGVNWRSSIMVNIERLEYNLCRTKYCTECVTMKLIPITRQSHMFYTSIAECIWDLIHLGNNRARFIRCIRNFTKKIINRNPCKKTHLFQNIFMGFSLK